MRDGVVGAAQRYRGSDEARGPAGDVVARPAGLVGYDEPTTPAPIALPGAIKKDPNSVYMMIVMESEEQARTREEDPRSAEGMALARATVEDIFDGSFEFVDLDVVEEVMP